MISRNMEDDASDLGWADGHNDIDGPWTPRPEEHGIKPHSDDWSEYMENYRDARKGWDQF